MIFILLYNFLESSSIVKTFWNLSDLSPEKWQSLLDLYFILCLVSLVLCRWHMYKKLASNFWCKSLVQEHQIERVLFRARNLHKKNPAASRCDRHASFV